MYTGERIFQVNGAGFIDLCGTLRVVGGFGSEGQLFCIMLMPAFL